MAKNSDLAKQYDPQAYEEAVYMQWEEAGVFQPDKEALKAGKKPFVIMLPPPNITGSLHMGHALQHTIMDILSRWHRMQGDPTLWLPGTDHAALPTNRIIEQQLRLEGLSRHDIGRDAFLERVDAWYKETGAIIVNQMKRLGSSCDWTRSRFTMDKEYVQSVNEAFIVFYKKGYIYRGVRIVNWDPKTQTTVSDLEVEYKTVKEPFYTFKYGPFKIGTARPETKFGDKYVVMHPDDPRYKQYKHGDKFEAEWINGVVQATIIKDDSIDMDFGTGVMTITPWHDATDFEIARRHNLDMEQIIGFDGKLLNIAGEFAGMDIQEARSRIVKKLEDKGLLVDINENYEHNVSVNERGHGVIEPQVMRQWFVDMQKLKQETLEVAEKELVSFVPPRWKNHFIDWMENVYDWNINRQIWLGHRLPVWWKLGTHGSDQEEGNFVVSVDKPEGEWEQDPDVLDTWFSSALWPFATLGWPNSTDDLKKFYPTDVLVTGRDILYLWVARMIFSGLELMQGEEYDNRNQEDRIPFNDVLIHPTVLTKKGQRMSKSLGTGVDPLDLIKQYGADATRFGLMYQMNYDRQAIKFDEQIIKTSRNFGNKIWNMARLILSMPVERTDETIADKWITMRADEVTSEVTQLLEEYKIGEAARLLHDFVWKDFADWYLEILKVEGKVAVGKDVFKRILQLLHPFMPHITEVLWQQFDDNKGMLVISAWPKSENIVDNSVTEAIEYTKDLVNTVRSARTLLDIKPGSTIHIDPKQEVSLAASLSELCRAEITELDISNENVIQFALQKGQVVSISSDEITSDSIEKAKNKLNKEKDELVKIVESQKEILGKMKGKAAQEKIDEREKVIVEKESRLKEIEQSLQLFS